MEFSLWGLDRRAFQIKRLGGSQESEFCLKRNEADSGALESHWKYLLRYVPTASLSMSLSPCWKSGKRLGILVVWMTFSNKVVGVEVEERQKCCSIWTLTFQLILPSRGPAVTNEIYDAQTVIPAAKSRYRINLKKYRITLPHRQKQAKRTKVEEMLTIRGDSEWLSTISSMVLNDVANNSPGK